MSECVRKILKINYSTEHLKKKYRRETASSSSRAFYLGSTVFLTMLKLQLDPTLYEQISSVSCVYITQILIWKWKYAS